MINKKSPNKNQGFTLIEVLVAIFVLITAVVVPLTIGSKAFAYSNFVRDQSTASYLAQEAMEYIRLVRDNTSLNSSPNGAWADFKSAVANCEGGPTNKIAGCHFSVMDSKQSFEACSGSQDQGQGDVSVTGCLPLYLQEDGTYGYNQTGTRSFMRVIQTHVENEGSGNLERMRVTVTLFWNTNGISERSFSVVNYLTPWQI